MNKPTLKQQMTNTVPAHAEPKSVAALLVDPKMKQQIALALPKHMTADRLARIALTEVRKNPKLAKADQTSFAGAIMQCAQLGLEPGSAMGHAYLLPFDKSYKEGNSWKKRTEVQLIIGYRGMLDLARRSGQILSISARVIYEKDQYAIGFGLEPVLNHVPAWNEADRGAPLFFYAVAKLKDGGTQFEVMSVAEVNAIRDKSQGYQSALSKAKENNKAPDTPWVNNYEEMGKKTVTRRLFKWLPVSIEMQTAVGLDEMADANLSQHNESIIDGSFVVDPVDDDDFHGDEADSGAKAKKPEAASTAQIIHDAIVAATDEDALNAAWELGGPDYQHGPELVGLYNHRMKELQA